MVSLGPTPEAATPSCEIEGDAQQRLDARADGTDPAKHVPTLAPPIYGEFPAKRHTVVTTKINQHWLDGSSPQPPTGWWRLGR